ncbi:hypothetical protein QTP88_001560 [Uroleucon formosanum]
MPMMAKLAMRIFAIPATSAGSERAFSTSGRVIEERRKCLKGDTGLHRAWLGWAFTGPGWAGNRIRMVRAGWASLYNFNFGRAWVS